MRPRSRNFDRTRTALIDAAAALFAARGYDAVAVDTIVQEAGVSKGAFYHHFDSKDDLLDAVAERMAVEAMKAIELAVTDRSVGALGRLNNFFAIARTWSADHFVLLREVLFVLYRDENVRLRRKVEAHSFGRSAAVLADILRQGVEEKVFDVSDPDEAAQAVLRFAWAIREAQVHLLRDHGNSADTLAMLERRLLLFFEMLERMIGAPKGAIERLRYPDIVGATLAEADGVPTAGRSGQR
jgi:AcrR family transcriptional regulator